MCFDIDLDPWRRQSLPDYYGYVPSKLKRRTVVFYSMFVFTACHVAIRMIGIALLVVLSFWLTVCVLGGDALVFFLFKVARGDLRYWLNVEGVLGWFMSIIVRFFTKQMVDFTVMVQLRRTYEQPSISHACSAYLTFLLFFLFLVSSPHLSFSDPNEIGGLYWIMCLALGQATSFVAVYLYSAAEARMETPPGGTSSRDLLKLLLGLEISFGVFFALFVVFMQRKFRITFFSTITGKQFNCQCFRDAQTDQVKIDVFNNHETYWHDIRGEVEIWIRDNYDFWVLESPEWFTDRVKASIPPYMIPKEENVAAIAIVRNVVSPSDKAAHVVEALGDDGHAARKRGSVIIAAELLEGAAKALARNDMLKRGSVMIAAELLEGAAKALARNDMRVDDSLGGFAEAGSDSDSDYEGGRQDHKKDWQVDLQ